PVLLVYEPGGTPLGEAIRELLLTPSPEVRPTDRAEALLFAAARAQLVENVIRPALDAGRTVICDRFGDSSLAYQAGGRGRPQEAIRALIRFATGGLAPDITFLLDLDVSTGLGRKAGVPADRMEREARRFHERVRDTYRRLAGAEPDRFVVVDANRPVDEIAAEALAVVLRRLPRSTRGADER